MHSGKLKLTKSFFQLRHASACFGMHACLPFFSLHACTITRWLFLMKTLWVFEIFFRLNPTQQRDTSGIEALHVIFRHFADTWSKRGVSCELSFDVEHHLKPSERGHCRIISRRYLHGSAWTERYGGFILISIPDSFPQLFGQSRLSEKCCLLFTSINKQRNFLGIPEFPPTLKDSKARSTRQSWQASFARGKSH